METFKELPVLGFETPAALRAWLAEHGDGSPGFWLRIYKKGSGVASVTYAEALDQALCFGWIDSQKARGDEASFLQRFTPRKPRSIWSKVNREHIERLRAEGRMTPAGEAEVARAQADGRWEAAYDSPSQATVPEDFATALAAMPRAAAFFETLNKTNRYAFLWRIQQAKTPAGRAKKIAWAVERLAAGEALH